MGCFEEVVTILWEGRRVNDLGGQLGFGMETAGIFEMFETADMALGWRWWIVYIALLT